MAKKRFHDSLWKPVGKAISDFQMIEEGDRIAAGVSGGKDSITLLYVLKEIQTFSPVKFELYAVTVDLGFGIDFSPIRNFCRQHNILWACVHTMIAPIVFDVRRESNPCSLCSKMRNGAFHMAAKHLGCNKVALAHHLDDTIETFFLCLFYEGRLKTFQPVSYLSRRDLTLIRPLIYVREKTIENFSRTFELPVVENPCPANRRTRREEMKELVSFLEKKFPGVKNRILTALKNFDPDNLWRKRF
ncbi:MAG: tRNA 2-thiocytidine biosynthesis protein TtcA [Thermoanaerobacterales bacterium 50_218]|nr:MAG: tRNA 2-thiocytidine biosynthesis protein TtcA [Thermoanaerobacterales bacterium 50_218]HAA90143.1 tRNA 2-thiocytidine(32) synthetase TtcA [Peptococcaceae bacterium]